MKIWHPYTQEALDGPDIKIDRGDGVWLYTTDGRRLLDGISSWWVNTHGHGHPLIAEAIAKQASKLEQVIFAGFTHHPAEELAERLGAIAPRLLSRLFFSDNGSTAVEVALKIAVQYWHNLGRPEKKRIVALENAYHGDTIGAMSVSADSPFTSSFESLRLRVSRIGNAGALRQLLAKSDDEIAALIVEPLIQGAGGMIVHSVDFLKQLRALCTQHSVLFIADEVFTGFGRTGKMFACDVAGIVPDLMCLSKGLTGGFLPLAVTLCTEKIYEAFYSVDRSRTFFHGHSYSGNPLGCAAANASLRIFATEPVFERIAEIERIHRERMPGLAKKAEAVDARILGTIAALELRADDPGYLSRLRSQLYASFIESGVLLRPLGNVVYVVPPYVIAPDELHHIYDVIERCVVFRF
jgi:adenosylmethionine---8-amino-7-oxononanoate aminotransferase